MTEPVSEVLYIFHHEVGTVQKRISRVTDEMCSKLLNIYLPCFWVSGTLNVHTHISAAEYEGTQLH